MPLLAVSGDCPLTHDMYWISLAGTLLPRLSFEIVTSA